MQHVSIKLQWMGIYCIMKSVPSVKSSKHSVGVGGENIKIGHGMAAVNDFPPSPNLCVSQRNISQTSTLSHSSLLITISNALSVLWGTSLLPQGFAKTLKSLVAMHNIQHKLLVWIFNSVLLSHIPQPLEIQEVGESLIYLFSYSPLPFFLNATLAIALGIYS